MIYKHKQYGIIWDVDPSNRSKGKLIQVGNNMGWNKSDVGTVLSNLNEEAWTNGLWIEITFSEYIKLLNK